MRGIFMSENTNMTAQTSAPEPKSDNIMQHIQDMIGDLLKNAVDKMQQSEVSKELGESSPGASGGSELPAQMGLPEVKNFVGVMQKFIDNINIMILQIETGSMEQSTDDKFLEGYMATADNVLEIAAFSMKDPLTGLSNRYGFDNRLILEWNRATRDKSDLSLVIFSIDGLADNDDNAARDEMLKTVSETLVSSIKRTTDFMARWSDNEFAALLPITNVGGASIVADRINAEVGNLDFSGIAEKGGTPSVSIGVCVQTPEPGEKPVDFINKAYGAFTKAKETDGNSIVFA